MRCGSCGETLTPRARFCAACGAPAPATPADDDPVRDALQRALGTHFRIERLLGRGGMGAVYLAHETGLDRPVAIKALPPDRAATPDSRERFRREARTAARLVHPNIVPLHAFGEEDALAYYVMGYVGGESLEARLLRDGPIPEEETCRILGEVARALDHAHRHGVVHRDVKPANILIEADTGRVLLTDFGIARAGGGDATLTVDGAVVGTPDFMSPEQASGQSDIGAASDVYSLGLTGYLMLAGRLPFEMGVAGRGDRLHPTPLRSIAPSVSDRTAAAIMRCLSADPADRWPDATAFAGAIAPAEDDEELPQALATLERFGLAVVVMCYAALALWLSTSAVREPGPGLQITSEVVRALAILVLLLAVGLGLFARLAGHRTRVIVEVMFREPPLWTVWYPSPLRCRANVWDRLPASVRRLRSFTFATIVVVVGLDLPLIGSLLYAALNPDNIKLGPIPQARLLIGVLGSLTGVALGALVVWSYALVRRFRRVGLTEHEASQFVLHAPLARAAFWRRPSIAALLGPAARPTPASAAEDSALTRTAGRPS